MVKVRELIEKAGGVFEIFTENVEGLQPEQIKAAFANKFEEFGYDGVEVTEVEVTQDGNIIVEFEDFEGDVMTILFGIDETEGVYALVVTDDMDDYFEYEDGDVLEIDLSPLSPYEIDSPWGKYLNLVDLEWLNRSTLSAILNIGDIDTSIEGGDEEEEEGEEEKVEIDDVESEPEGEVIPQGEKLNELFKVVVRGGKKVKLPLVRKKRRKVLTSKQRAGIRKAVKGRKRVAAQSARKRTKSLRIRKNLNVKPQGTPKGYKVQQ